MQKKDVFKNHHDQKQYRRSDAFYGAEGNNSDCRLYAVTAACRHAAQPCKRQKNQQAGKIGIEIFCDRQTEQSKQYRTDNQNQRCRVKKGIIGLIIDNVRSGGVDDVI